MAFAFTLESKKNYALVVPMGELLSAFDAKEMLETVDKELAHHKNFIIDLGKLNHLNSEGINVLLNILTRSRNAGGETIICNLSTHIKSLFLITKLNNIFTITTDKKSAVSKLELA